MTKVSGRSMLAEALLLIVELTAALGPLALMSPEVLYLIWER
jgi:hypothetical protein